MNKILLMLLLGITIAFAGINDNKFIIHILDQHYDDTPNDSKKLLEPDSFGLGFIYNDISIGVYRNRYNGSTGYIKYVYSLNNLWDVSAGIQTGAKYKYNDIIYYRQNSINKSDYEPIIEISYSYNNIRLSATSMKSLNLSLLF